MNALPVRWQRLEQNGHAGYLYRAEVPGGWLVKAVDEIMQPPLPAGYPFGGREYDTVSSMTFLPDPEHAWSPELAK